MPIHDFLCPNCNKEFEIYQQVDNLLDKVMCECGKLADKVWSAKSSAQINVFKPEWFEHIAHEPIWIDSRKKLISECKKHNCRSKYIEDSYRGT